MTIVTLPINHTQAAIHAIHWDSKMDAKDEIAAQMNAFHATTQCVAHQRVKLFRQAHRNASAGKKSEKVGQTALSDSRLQAAKRSAKRVAEDKRKKEQIQEEEERERSTYWYADRHPFYATSLSKTRAKLHWEEVNKDRRKAEKQNKEMKQQRSLWKKTFKSLLEAVEKRKQQTTTYGRS